MKKKKELSIKLDLEIIKKIIGVLGIFLLAFIISNVVFYILVPLALVVFKFLTHALTLFSLLSIEGQFFGALVLMYLFYKIFGAFINFCFFLFGIMVKGWRIVINENPKK